MADMLLEPLCNRRSDNEHVNNKSGLRCVFGIFDLQGTFGLFEATYTMDQTTQLISPALTTTASMLLCLSQHTFVRLVCFGYRL